MGKEARVPVLVEFTERPGVKFVAIKKDNLGELEEASGKALDHAMGTIEEISRRFGDLQDRMPMEFSDVTMEFGLTLDMEAGALIAKVATGASITVTLTWKRPETK